MSSEIIRPKTTIPGGWSGEYREIEPSESPDPPKRIARLVGGPYDGQEYMLDENWLFVRVEQTGDLPITYYRWGDGTFRIESESI